MHLVGHISSHGQRIRQLRFKSSALSAYASAFATTLCAPFACLALALNVSERSERTCPQAFSPSAIRTAPHVDEQVGLDAYTQDLLTVPAPLVGLPALVVRIEVGGRRATAWCGHCWARRV